ncbi:MAG: acyl-CoA dehydrogenase family protein [Moraxellaceae bacterium]|nr:acyl-CoA dehydrogenase family protein [Moraxellaceae bacterium]MDP1776368.1 acyl-CoA dehydrogenase family protein [Moraxellaceae bacterium]
MNFELDDEQRLLADSAERFLTQSYSFESRRQRVKQGRQLDHDVWQAFADAGWFHLPFSEAEGGLGGRLQDSMVLMQTLAKGLIIEPLWANTYLAGSLIKRINHPLKQPWLESLMAGKGHFALAVHEYEQAFSITNSCNTLATHEATGYRLNGRKCVVLNAELAQWIFVLANIDDELALLAVERDTAGVHVSGHRLVDGSRAAEVTFNNVLIAEENRLQASGGISLLMQQTLHEAGLALAAEACGIIDALMSTTLAFVKTRKQFGVAIGQFQALQHRLVNMFMMSENCRSLLYAATLKAEERHDDASVVYHRLQAMVAEYGRHIAQECIQLHGGMGMTDEVMVGHYLKRLLCIESLTGDLRHHLLASIEPVSTQANVA